MSTPSTSTAYNVLDKTPNETVNFGMPFSAKIANGDSLKTTGTISATIVTNGVDTGTTTSDLVFTGAAIVTNMVGAVPPGPGISVFISGGVSGKTYMVHFVGVQTAAGQTLENEGMVVCQY